MVDKSKPQNQNNTEEKQISAIQWFKDTMKSIKPQATGKPVNYTEILTNNVKTAKRRLIGQVLLFKYRPSEKTKFFDQYPLIIVLGFNKGVIQGLNLHYVPPIDRIKLILLMNSLIYNQKEQDIQKVRVKILSLLNKKIFAKYVGTIVNNYTLQNIQGKPKITNAKEWSHFAFLPVFKGISPSTIYSEVKQEVKNYNGNKSKN